MPEFECLTWDTSDHIVRVGFNRPQKRNAFNLQMLRDLGHAYQAYEADKDLRCLILFPHGDDFTAGLDLSEVGPAVESGQALFPGNAIDPLGLHEPKRTKPVICAVRGWCLTIGIELMLASDINIAGHGTRFSQMEIKRGIMPFGGATMRLPQIAGWGNAMRYLLTADQFDTETALRIGLAQEAAADADVLDVAEAIAGRIAKQAPLGVQATILSARQSLETGFEQANHALLDQARQLMQSEDAKEGVQSFIERRDANFQGR